MNWNVLFWILLTLLAGLLIIIDASHTWYVVAHVIAAVFFALCARFAWKP